MLRKTVLKNQLSFHFPLWIWPTKCPWILRNRRVPKNIQNFCLFVQNSFSSHPTYGLSFEPQPYVNTAPSLQTPHQGMQNFHVLQSLLSTLVSCTISLQELLQVHMHLWSKVINTSIAQNHHPPSRVVASTTFHNLHTKKFIKRVLLFIRKLNGPSNHAWGHITLPEKHGDILHCLRNMVT